MKTETESGVNHTGKDLLNFRLAASEFLMTHDVWTGDKDYKRLGDALEGLLKKMYEQGRLSAIADFVRKAIDERTRK